MQINVLEEINIDDFIFVGALPDMGRVGGLVSSHLVHKLNTKKIADIIINDKPWINQEDGLVSIPSDKYELWIDEKNKIVIFTGDNQPQEPTSVMNLTGQIMKKVQDIGRIKLIITAGGYLPAEEKNEQEIFAVATKDEILKELKHYNILPLGPDVNSITWFNGLLMGFAKKNNIDGMGLFGIINDADSPQFKTASNIIKAIEKITQTRIGTGELDERVNPPEKEGKLEGPGIG